MPTPTARTRQLRDEFIDVINLIYPEDLTDGELKALTAILKGALERKEWRVPVLRLVLSSEGTKPR